GPEVDIGQYPIGSSVHNSCYIYRFDLKHPYMKYKSSLKAYLSCIVSLLFITLPSTARTADKRERSHIIQKTDSIPGYAYPISGVVYFDRNANHQQDAGESGIAGIAVSDG